MAQKTRPDIWPVERPFVVFMVPSDRYVEYAAVMTRLANNVFQDLGWSKDSVDYVGLISSSAQHGVEGILFLEETGIDTRSVTLLILWGETAESVNFEHLVSEECGIGKVILPATGVVLPTVRMPALDTGWWADSLHVEYATTVLTSLVRNGRYEFDGTEPYAHVVYPGTWN